MTLFEHMDGIDEMVQKSQAEQNNYMMLAAGTGGGSAFAKDFAGGSGPLKSDVFGNVTAGNSNFTLFKIAPPVVPGVLNSDVFGNLRSGNSMLSSGKIDSHGFSGDVQTNVFGNVTVGDSNFSSGQL